MVFMPRLMATIHIRSCHSVSPNVRFQRLFITKPAIDTPMVDKMRPNRYQKE